MIAAPEVVLGQGEGRLQARVVVQPVFGYYLRVRVLSHLDFLRLAHHRKSPFAGHIVGRAPNDT